MSTAGLSFVSPSPQPTTDAAMTATPSTALRATSAGKHANWPRFVADRRGERRAELEGVVIDMQRLLRRMLAAVFHENDTPSVWPAARRIADLEQVKADQLSIDTRDGRR
jgi:hypothetical protein